MRGWSGSTNLVMLRGDIKEEYRTNSRDSHKTSTLVLGRGGKGRTERILRGEGYDRSRKLFMGKEKRPRGLSDRYL